MIQVKSYSIGHEYPAQCVMYNTKFYSKTCVCVSQSSAQPGDNQVYYNNFFGIYITKLSPFCGYNVT